LPNAWLKNLHWALAWVFFKRAVDPAFVEAEARATITSDPKWVCAKLNLHDGEIEDLSVTLDKLREESASWNAQSTKYLYRISDSDSNHFPWQRRDKIPTASF